MLQPIKLANAAALVCVVGQVIYVLLIVLAPGLVHTYVVSLTPGYDLSAIEPRDQGMDYGGALLGVIFVAISIWVWVFATVSLYNRWAK